MMDFTTIGRWLVVAGLVLALVGGGLWLVGRLLPRPLPGTIQIDLGGISCVVPLLASLILSVVLTVLLNLLVRLFNR